MNSIARAACWFVMVSSMVACGGATSSDSSNGGTTDDALSVAAKRYVGTYVAAGGTLGFQNLELKSNGTYTALIAPANEADPVVVLAKGHFTVKTSRVTPDQLTLTDGTGNAETYSIGLRTDGGITLTQGADHEDLNQTYDSSGGSGSGLSDVAKTYRGAYVQTANTLGYRSLQLMDGGDYSSERQEPCTGDGQFCDRHITLENGKWSVATKSGRDAITLSPTGGSDSVYTIKHLRAGQDVANGISLTAKDGTIEAMTFEPENTPRN